MSALLSLIRLASYQFFQLFRWELYKLVKRPSSYVGLGLCVVFCGIIMIVFGTSQFRALEHSARGVTADPRAYVNGYLFSTFVLYFGHKALLPLLAGIIPGAQIAGEAKDGTLRAMLTRPPSRLAMFAAKLAVSALWVLITVYFLIFFSLLMGYAFLGGGDFLVFVWEFQDYGAWFAREGDWLPMFLAVGLGSTAALLPVVVFSLSLSALTDNPVVAYVGALGGFFISSIVQRLPDRVLHPTVREVMPTTHMEFWHEFYWLFHPTGGHLDAGRLVSDLKWCAMYTILFLTIGLCVFLRKDIKT